MTSRAIYGVFKSYTLKLVKTNTLHVGSKDDMHGSLNYARDFYVLWGYFLCPYFYDKPTFLSVKLLLL